MDEISKIGHGISALVTAIIGLAILAIVLSNGSNTVNVLSTFFGGLSTLLQTVIQPVTAGSSSSSANSIISATDTVGSPFNNALTGGLGEFF